ncbi:hypothetical protein CFK37_09610 [Virgibacillus phasianinus]|uniref:Uncharacterized protein n=1 Tax=Virgibacillus phasianinus TaxID=2017483 RepID=A0A220U299_9BACI|nr:hypothetical protein [Virgibacillus phasianinus]ASK62394.1 hypothetical protein CFK37_09610 [Virgibacillus phasianinus]
MRQNWHILGIFLGVAFYVFGELLCMVFGLIDHSETYWDYFVNYFVLFGIFGFSIVIIMYYASKVVEYTAGWRSLCIYTIFLFILPTYIFARMLYFTFDIEYITEAASLLYSVMVLLFVFLREDIFAG